MTTLILGRGWSATAAAKICSQNKLDEIHLCLGSQATLYPLVPAFPGLASLKVAGVEEDQTEKGIFYRFYKNKAFKTPTFESLAENLWAPEKAIFVDQEYKNSDLTTYEWLQQTQAELDQNSAIKRHEGSIIEFEVQGDRVQVQFSDGQKTIFDRVIFADTMNELKANSKLQGLFKNQIPAVKNSQLYGLLQVHFVHQNPCQQPQGLGFIVSMNKEAGEDMDRHTFGYFLNENESVWSALITPEESEDNHEIMKRLKKIKQAIAKAFESDPTAFTFKKEIVRFEPKCLAESGTFRPGSFSKYSILLSDIFGFNAAMERVASVFDLRVTQNAETQAGSVHSKNAPELTA